MTDWFTSDASQRSRDDADGYWPPGLDQQEHVFVAVQSLGLIADMAEHSAESGSLPELDSLALTTEERTQLLRDELAATEALARQQGQRFSYIGDQTYQLRPKGLRNRSEARRFWIAVLDFGVIMHMPAG